jgi:hypothetical protein
VATENAVQGHTTVDEEEATVVMNWQSDNFNNNGHDNSRSYESPKDRLSYLLLKRGAQKGSDEQYPNHNHNICCMQSIKSPYSICRLAIVSKM